MHRGSLTDDAVNFSGGEALDYTTSCFCNLKNLISGILIRDLGAFNYSYCWPSFGTRCAEMEEIILIVRHG